jgi:hypothetical protein
MSDIGEMQKRVLLEADVNERCTDTRHHFGHTAKVNIPNVSVFSGSFYKEFGKFAVFKDCDPMLVRSGIDDDVFFHVSLDTTAASGR